MEPDRDRAERIEGLFAEHARAVRAYALRRVDATTAEDVVSDVFVVAFRRLETVPDPALPWLLATARKIIANHRRAVSRRERLDSELRPLQTGTSIDGGAEHPLLVALAGLSEGDREVILLVAWEELSAAQAATVVGCSRAAFAVRLHRARRRLAARMGEQHWNGSLPLRLIEAAHE